MRILLATAAAVGLAGIAVSATAPQYTFEFTVRVNDTAPVALNLSAAPGTTHSLHATDHLSLEIEAPSSTSDAAVTVVRLIDDSSGKPVVLHTARSSGPVSLVRTAGYAVCGGKTTFQSPLQSNPPLECVK